MLREEAFTLLATGEMYIYTLADSVKEVAAYQLPEASTAPKTLRTIRDAEKYIVGLRTVRLCRFLRTMK